MRKKVEAHQNAVLRLSILELQLIFLSQNFLDIAGHKSQKEPMFMKSKTLIAVP